MKKIFLLVCIYTLVFAKTIVVDSDAGWSFQCIGGWVVEWKTCEGCVAKANVSTTIGGGVDKASDGDTIKICAGEYNEQVEITDKENLRLTSGKDVSFPKDVNWTYDGYVLRLDGSGVQNIRVENISLQGTGNRDTIELREGRGFHTFNTIIKSDRARGVRGRAQFGGTIEFEDTNISAKSDGVRIDNADSLSFDGVRVFNANRGIYIDVNVPVVFSNVTVSANSYGVYINNSGDLDVDNSAFKAEDIAFYVRNSNGTYDFRNVQFYSENDKALRINRGQNIIVEHADIDAGDDGIYIGNNVYGNYNFSDIDITSNGSNGIYILNGKNISMQDINLSTVTTAVYIGTNVYGDYTFKNIKIKKTDDNGIHIRNGNDINVTSSTIVSQDSSIYISDDTYGNYLFKNLDLNSSLRSGIKIDKGANIAILDTNITSDEQAIYMRTDDVYGDYKLENLRIVTYSKDGIEIDNAQNIDIENSCIWKKADSSGEYGVRIDSDNSDYWNPITLKNNCFYGNPIDSLAYAKNLNTVQSNYWDNLQESTYHYNNILDLHPLSSCPNDCSFKFFTLKADYQMDECCWGGVSGEVNDSSGNGLHGTASIANTESNSSVEGVLCRVGDFTYVPTDDSDDSDDDLVEIPKDVLDEVKDFTVMFWIKTDEVLTGGSNPEYMTFISAANSSNDNEFWFYATRANLIKVRLKNREQEFSISATLNDNGWHHIVFTRRGLEGCVIVDGDTSNKVCQTFDGASAGTLDVEAIVLAQDQDVLRGGYRVRDDFAGYMDELKFYEGVVPDNEIQRIYNNEKDRRNFDGTNRSCKDCSLPAVVMEYRMDECSWDDDITTLEVKNSGSAGDEYNATARNGANTQNDDGGICRVGNFISSSSEDKVLTFQNNFPLTSSYTITVWIKFPLTEDGHKLFNNRYEYFKIADRKDSAKDYLYFRHDTSDDSWVLTVADDSTYSRQDFNPQNLDGWHFLAFVVSQNRTDFYFDGEYNSTFDAHPTTGELALLFNSDYQASGSGEPNQQSIGTLVDEFKLFDSALLSCDIKNIYQNEKNGKNYDGTERTCEDCLAKLLIAQWRFDECGWDSDPNTYEVLNDKDTNYNATALNGAKPLPAKVCNGGDIDSAIDGNIALRLKNSFSLPQRYTYNTWIRFPLETANHKTFTANSQNVEYYNIADRVGSGNDFIYFEYIEDGGWYLVIDGNNNSSDALELNPQNLTGWHMLTFVVKNGTTDFYFDADFNYTFGVSPNGGDLGLLFNSDYKANDNEPNGQAIGALVDEVKIFQGELTSQEIQSLLSESRSCPNCNRNYKFDCWDTFRDEQDRNISTKIVAKAFNLNLAEVNESGAYSNEFNGTVCTTIFDTATQKRVSDWNATHWNNNTPDEDNNQTIQFIVGKAVQGAKVYIYWIENGYESNDSCSGLFGHEGNETNTTDDFAIRPDHFEIVVSTPVYAGEDFNITLYAKDSANNFTIDYNESKDVSFKVEANETKSGCTSATLSLDNFAFNDGKAQNITANYDDIGEINVSIYEIDGSEFARVDRDDTNDSQRLIESNWTLVHIFPYEANVTELNFTISTQRNWLYVIKDTNIDDMNITIDVTVEVFSKNGTSLEDFNSSCYGSDVDVKFFYEVNNTSKEDADSISVVYLGTKDDSAATLADINKTLTIPIANFSNGKGSVSYAFDVNRSFDAPLSPIWLQLQDVSIESSIAKLLHSAQDTDKVEEDMNATLYYARVKPFDITTSKQDDSTKADILVYDDQNSDYTQDLQEILVDWFLMRSHTSEEEGKIVQTVVKSGVGMQDSDITSISVSPTLGEGEYNISISNPDKVESAYIHLDISPWLWFSYDYDYSFASDSDCANHPCIRYLFFKDVSGGGIRSGNVKGVRFEANVSKNPRGVKVFR